jgi:hypothetical protein
MERVKDYMQQASECRSLAANANLPAMKQSLLQMADRCEELARERAAQMNLQVALAELLKNGNHNGGAPA